MTSATAVSPATVSSVPRPRVRGVSAGEDMDRKARLEGIGDGEVCAYAKAGGAEALRGAAGHFGPKGEPMSASFV